MMSAKVEHGCGVKISIGTILDSMTILEALREGRIWFRIIEFTAKRWHVEQNFSFSWNFPSSLFI